VELIEEEESDFKNIHNFFEEDQDPEGENQWEDEEEGD
jgi:hypothetical protein